MSVLIPMRASLLGILINIMGGVDSSGRPDASYMGFSLWHHPGAFHNGFKGLCSVFVTAAFAFAGTELVGLAAAETENPRKALPTAIKQVSVRNLVRLAPTSSSGANRFSGVSRSSTSSVCS